MACAHPAWAAVTESDFLDDLPVVLSVSRLSQPVSEAPAAVTIIDREMIRASCFRDIPDLLRLVPGFSVAYTRNNTWAAGYHGLGDAFSRRFQVLVDGRSIYSPHYGAVYWADLPLSIDDIERIEVVRGPNAAIHGANAFVAVINIITKTAAQVPGESVSLQLGDHGMRGLTARYGGGDETLRYRLTASAQHRDRFDRDVTNKIAWDSGQYFEASNTYFVNGRMDWQLSSNSDAMLQFGLSQGDWNAGMQVNDPLNLDPVSEPFEQDSRAQYLQFAYHKVESMQREWRVQAYHSRNRFDADKLAPLVLTTPPFPITFDDVLDINEYLLQTRSNVELQVNEQWSPSLRGVWGGEVRQETVNSPQNYNSSKTRSGVLARAFGNLEWRAGERVLLQGGAMLEHHYFTGFDLSPRVAANFTLSPGHVLRMGVSRAYRSPTFFEEAGNKTILTTSGSVADVATVPSTGLEPESILSREIGYVGRFRPMHLELDVRLFRDHIENFIGMVKISPNPAFDAGSFQPKVFFADNLGMVDTQGGEIQLRWRPVRSLDVSAHYARVFLSVELDPENVVDAKNYKRDIPVSAPRNSWGLLANYRMGNGWEASLFAQRSDAQKWLTEGDDTEAFTRVDVRLARHWKWQGRQVEAAVVGQNLGGDYHEFRDTNIFSRRVYGSLSLAW